MINMKPRDLSLIFLLFGITTFFIGLHNIDIAFNMNLIGENWKHDINVGGEIKTSKEIYMDAWKILGSGLFLMLLAFLMAYFL